MDSFSGARRTLAGIIAAALCGAIGWSGHAVALPLTFFFPVSFLIQPDRRSGYAVAWVYYAASTWPLVPGAGTFFGPHSMFWLDLGFWLAASSLLAVPWGLFLFGSWPARYASTAAALAATTLPPLGLIGWASPLTAAGLLFPGFGWLGILAILLLPPMIARRPIAGLITLIVLIVTAHWLGDGQPAPPAGWAAVNTAFGGDPERSDPVREYQNARTVQQLALSSEARIVVFPEGAAPLWNDATEFYWEPAFKALGGHGQTVLLGTTIALPGTLTRLNGVLIRGWGKLGFFIQHVPVPVAMWRPFTSAGFPLRLAGPGTVRIAGERTGILICYEMLLSWPFLRMSLEHPTILVGVADDYWARATPIPRVQQMCISAWAKLFSVPWLMARNI